jgi:hypothetical protein
MSQRDLLQRLLQFTDQYNISQHDLHRLPAKALVLSLKYVDRRALYQQLFPDRRTSSRTGSCWSSTAWARQGALGTLRRG